MMQRNYSKEHFPPLVYPALLFGLPEITEISHLYNHDMSPLLILYLQIVKRAPAPPVESYNEEKEEY
jgi:hypothetical protein